MGWNYFCKICHSMFYFKIQTSWTYLNVKFNDLKNVKQKIINGLYQCRIYKITPPFHWEERMVNWARRREYFASLSFVYYK